MTTLLYRCSICGKKYTTVTLSARTTPTRIACRVGSKRCLGMLELISVNGIEAPKPKLVRDVKKFYPYDHKGMTMKDVYPELIEEKRHTRSLQRSKVGVCKIIHRRRVLSELEQDKESLFRGKKIESLLKVKCKRGGRRK